MHVLITGASGYIGQHLTKALLNRNWEVSGIGRSRKPKNLKVSKWIQGRITDPEAIKEAIGGVTTIIHLAANSLDASTNSPEEADRINTGGTVRLLEAARRNRIERFLYASSGQVYGGSSRLPNSEDDFARPTSPYAASKLAAEIWCRLYSKIHNLPVTILRLFNVYGLAVDGSPRSTVETIFLQQILLGKRPRIIGNPLSGRDFVHVDDVVNAMVLSLNNPTQRKIINVGTGTMTTLKNLAQMAGEIMGSDTQPEIAGTANELSRYQADTTRAKNALGFEARIELKNGLQSIARALRKD